MLFWIVFVVAFVISAIILRTIANFFMSLMGADMYFFHVRPRVVICCIVAFIAACFTLPG